eukprot:TRINITY_DN23327_c0_g2_i1.p1 TRINITY_DN23327_c0_g2~~TRINITY_DN23327_c0_g2_i1.p1  ORF type:complete len:476 (-),score=97.09 TRINITY_DN23327_c0_g2_i1:313-1740(-)
MEAPEAPTGAVPAGASSAASAGYCTEAPVAAADVRFHCDVCQSGWTGPPDSWAQHLRGATHGKRLRAAARRQAEEEAARERAAASGLDAAALERLRAAAPAWSHLPARAGTAAAAPLWPWPGTTTAWDKVTEGFTRRLCQRGRVGLSSLQSGAPSSADDGSSQHQNAAEIVVTAGKDDGQTEASGLAPGPDVTAERTASGLLADSDATEKTDVGESIDQLDPRTCTVAQRCAQKAAAVQERMRTCTQQPDDFSDAEALWGYAAAKFSLRAGMTFRALSKRATPALKKTLTQDVVSVAAMGGGPAAEIFAAVVARDILGGGRGRLAVCEWVDDWRPVVDSVGQLLDQPIEYHHCDVTMPLNHEANAALLEGGFNFDIVIFSHVLLEAGRGGSAGSSDESTASLALLRDLWTDCPQVSHILVLDAGQARGKGRRSRPLAGSLRAVELLAETLDTQFSRVEGDLRTDGVLLSRPGLPE